MMRQKRYTILKPEHGSPEWLAVRWRDDTGRARISASACAAVHGEHEFTTSADLASELLAANPPQPKEQNAAMERGNRLEPTLIKWASDREGVEFFTPDWMYVYEEDGVRLIATIDAIANPDDADQRIMEVKTTKRRWEGDMPRYWYWQGIHQAVCTGATQIEWAIFDSDLTLHKHIQKVSSDEKQTHIEACRKFLAAIDMGFAPEGVQFSYQHITEQHPAGGEGQVEVDEATVLASLERLALAKQQKQEAEAVEDLVKAELCALLGDGEYATAGGRLLYTWKTAHREMLDAKRFEAEHPALFAKFKKVSSYRTFRVVAK
jgi:predicted phage-related endonuclease